MMQQSAIETPRYLATQVYGSVVYSMFSRLRSRFVMCQLKQRAKDTQLRYAFLNTRIHFPQTGGELECSNVAHGNAYQRKRATILYHRR